MSKTKVSEVKLSERLEIPYFGIRVRTPFKGMFRVVSTLSRDLIRYFAQHGLGSLAAQATRVVELTC